MGNLAKREESDGIGQVGDSTTQKPSSDSAKIIGDITQQVATNAMPITGDDDNDSGSWGDGSACIVVARAATVSPCK